MANAPKRAPKASAAAEEDRVDGRRAWRDRNLNAVVDALLDLFAEGNLRPGADEIAERSGVSRRSVFRYFDDLDALNRVAIERQLARVAHLVEIPEIGEGTLEERVDALVEQRTRLFDAIATVAKVTRLRAPFEPVVNDELQRSRRLFMRQIERHFDAELAKMQRPARNATAHAAAALSSFETYDLLRNGHGLSPKNVAEAMRRGLRALFA